LRNEWRIWVNRGDYETIDYHAVVRWRRRNVHISNNLKVT